MAATCDGIMARRADVARTPFFAMSVTGCRLITLKRTSLPARLKCSLTRKLLHPDWVGRAIKDDYFGMPTNSAPVNWPSFMSGA